MASAVPGLRASVLSWWTLLVEDAQPLPWKHLSGSKGPPPQHLGAASAVNRGPFWGFALSSGKNAVGVGPAQLWPRAQSCCVLPAPGAGSQPLLRRPDTRTLQARASAPCSHHVLDCGLTTPVALGTLGRSIAEGRASDSHQNSRCPVASAGARGWWPGAGHP